MSTSGAAPAGGPPSGAAGGDLAGVYPAPSVAKIQGTAVSAVAPTNSQLFQLVGGIWTPTTLVIPGPAASVTGPDAFGAASAVGVSTAYARQDHDHGLPANPAPAPSGVVTGPDAFGDAAAVGTSAAFSRGDHNHGLPANPQRAPATTVTGPDAFGAASVVGTSVLFARQDHDHGLPANPSAAFAVPAIALGTAAAAGAAGTKIRSDATIAAFDATVPVTQAYSDAAATGAAAVAARRDHRHGMPAAASLTSASSFITSDVAIAASTATAITSLSLAAGTWLVIAQALLINTGVSSAALADIWLSTTSAGGAAAALGSASENGFLSSSTGNGWMLNFSCIVTPGATTTYFLNGEMGVASSAKHLGQLAATPNVTGMTAVKIA